YLVAKTPEYKAKIEEKIATIDKRLERIGIAISGLTLWQQERENNDKNTGNPENTNNPDKPVDGENKPDQKSPVDGENVLDNDFDNFEKVVPPPKNDTPTNIKTEPLPQNQSSKPIDQKPIVDIKSTDDNTNINTPNNRNNNSDNDGTDKNPSNELAKETNIETDKNQNKEPAEGNADEVAASDTTTDTDKVDEAEEAGIVAGAVENDGDNNIGNDGGKIETSSLGEFLGGNKVGFGFLKNDTAGLHTETERISAHNTKAKEKSQLILLNSQDVMVWLRTSLVAIREIGESAFLVLIFTIFMIFEAASFPSKVDRALGFDGPINNQHLQKIAGEIRRYLFLKAISSMMSAVAATAVYWFFGVPAMFFWGVVAFFLYFIPNVGGIIASIIPGLLIFMTHDWQGVVIYMICLVGIECTIGYGIEPKMLGHGLGISTVVILLSLFTWGMLLGPIGLFMAAPLTIMVKITLQAFKETEWLATLIDRK
ncbi:MAG: AI-2E family transporter, partial [Planctomycetaceae bacterium]|nr:AI-2E family transporter [Planctomycetaceae bacterium]